MLHLIWGLINIGVFIFFIFICFKAAKYIKEKIGIFVAILFVLGLLSLNFNNHKIEKWTFAGQDEVMANSMQNLHLTLEKTMVSSFSLDLIYGKNNQTKEVIPYQAYSLLTGFGSGKNWEPHSIFVTKKENENKFEYSIEGTLEWQLLGTTLYSQSKSYTGSIEVK